MSNVREIELETLMNNNELNEEDNTIFTDIKVPFNLGSMLRTIFSNTFKYLTSKLDILILCLVLFAISILLFGCIVRIHLGSDGTQYVKNTIEYQIEKLAGIPNITDRMANVQKWTKLFNENSNLIQLDIEDGEALLRQQYSVSVHTCNIETYIRVREYLDGSQAGKMTMDIKANSHNQWRAKNYPFWPAFDYIDMSYQKCEKDIHDECESKYSRDTRMFFDEYQSFNVCSDVFKYYPYAGSDLSKSNAPVKPNSKEPWWIFRYLGNYGNSDYEISYTLRYATKDDAVTENHAPIYGEWSIRITTTDHGYDETWDEIFKADVEKAYHAIVLEMSEAKC